MKILLAISVLNNNLYRRPAYHASFFQFFLVICLVLFSCDMEEKKDEEDSTLNEGEAEVAIAHAKRLVESGVQASNIGIITPYNAQVCQLTLSSFFL